MDDAAIGQDFEVVDFTRGLTGKQKERIVPVDIIPAELIASAQTTFRLRHNPSSVSKPDTDRAIRPCIIYEHKDFPGKPNESFEYSSLTNHRSPDPPVTLTPRLSTSYARLNPPPRPL